MSYTHSREPLAAAHSPKTTRRALITGLGAAVIAAPAAAVDPRVLRLLLAPRAKALPDPSPLLVLATRTALTDNGDNTYTGTTNPSSGSPTTLWPAGTDGLLISLERPVNGSFVHFGVQNNGGNPTTSSTRDSLHYGCIIQADGTVQYATLSFGGTTIDTAFPGAGLRYAIRRITGGTIVLSRSTDYGNTWADLYTFVTGNLDALSVGYYTIGGHTIYRPHGFGLV
jgi:hypothetical protein